VAGGVRRALAATLALGAAAFLLQRMFYAALPPLEHGPAVAGLRERFRSWPPELRRLLAADILARLAEGTSEIFLVLYLMNVVGLGAVQFGSLITVQMVTAIVLYLPAGRLADRWGRYPLVLATFFFFALFPLAVWASGNYWTALLAFLVGGLREFGEPARKAQIVDLAGKAGSAGRDVGLYYLLRGLAVAPAALVGGLLWQVRPWLPLAISGAVGLCGVGLYARRRM